MADQENSVRLPSEEDTRTRKTVRLRPIAPAPAPTQLADPLSGRNTNTGNLEVLSDTQTRRTVKLKPLAPAGAAAPAPVAPAAPVAPPKPVMPAAPAVEDDTRTRKSVVIRPKTVAPVALTAYCICQL